MQDPRIEKLADVLLNYCIKLKNKQLLCIAGSPLATPLIKELYKRALLIGAYPYTRIMVEGIEEIYFKYASDEQLRFISPLRKFEMQKIDSLVSIISTYNTKSLTGVNPRKQALAQKTNAPLTKIFMDRSAKEELLWVGCMYPTFASAQDAGMSLTDYENFVFSACKLGSKNPVAEWQKVSEYNARLIKYISKKKKIRIVADETDLTYNVAGRKWINCDGAANFPDGEIFTAPIENSAEGCIRFTYPAVFGGREVEDVRLEFRNGKAVKARASKGEDFMNAMLDTDKGSRYLGEVAIGTNYDIKDFSKNTLFDEKIGGTIHMALGAAYPETGGKNRSGLHWDMVCDLRQGGEIYGDGELFYRNGKFLK